jgi:integrase/recombinase XerD
MSKKKSTSAIPWEITPDMFLSEPETAALVKYVRDRQSHTTGEQQLRASVDRMIIELLLFSGLRNSELCHLRVIDTVVGHGHAALQIAGTPKQDRLVFIPESLSQEVSRFVKDVRPECVSESTNSSDQFQPLILNERGRPYDRTALYRRVIRTLTEAGLADRASVQLLRHTYGFLAYKRTGGNLLFVQQQLGHSHPMVTAVYANFVHFSATELANHVMGDNATFPEVQPLHHFSPAKKRKKR